MGQSKGGGGGKKAGKAAANITNEIAAETRPARDQYFADLLAAVQGRGDQIPAAQAAYRDSMAGTEQSLARQKAIYASEGIEATYAAPRLEAARSVGGQAAADARQAVINQFLGAAPSASLGATGQAQSGLLDVARRGAAITAGRQAQTSAEIGAGTAAIGAILAALL
jgi:hypothetical protein